MAVSLPTERVLGTGRRAIVPLLAPIGSFALIGGLGASQGGYFPTAYCWAAVTCLWLAAVGLLLKEKAHLDSLQVAMILALAALTGWMALSTAWSAAAGEVALEVQRALLYLGAVAALFLLAPARSARSILGAILAAIVLVTLYGLATRLFPDRLGTYDPIAGYRLQEPIGYWNALAIFAVLGVLIALGFAARGKRLLTRAVAAASLVVLVPTVYFTFSRGAWIALGLALFAAVALDGRRLQFVTALFALAPVPALAVWLSSQSNALTRKQEMIEEASRDGYRLAAAIALFALISAVIAAVFAFAETRISPPRWLQLAYAGALTLVAIAALVAVFARYGGPLTLAEKGYDAFRAPPPQVSSDLTERLFNLSGRGRTDHWEVAWEQYNANPWLGGGAGTYEQYWYEFRPTDSNVRDAHSLYLETLAELGPVGLALLLVALGIPLVAAVRARGHPLVPAAFAAYVAYLVHAGVDWDWEMPAVTVAALFCGGGVMLVAARDRDRKIISSPVRFGLLGAAIVLMAFAFVGFLGNSATAAADAADRAGDYRTSETEARKAMRWAPWSPEPWRLLGEAQLERGDSATARESFRTALAKDPRNWYLWLDLAAASEGAARKQALARAVSLNPLGREVAESKAALERDAKKRK